MKDFLFFRILHIEDDHLIISLVARMLASVAPFAHVELIAVKSLSQGLQLLRTQAFDVVLLDLGLPDCEGMDSFHHVHGATDLPIVVLTGDEDLDQRIETVSAGAQDCIYKMEMTPDVLLRSIRFAVERHRYVTEMVHALKELRAGKLALEEIIEQLRLRDH